MTSDKLIKMLGIANNIIAGGVIDPVTERVTFEYEAIRFFIDARGKKGAFTFHAIMPRIDRNVNAWEAEQEWKKQIRIINVGQDKPADKCAADFKRRFDFESLNRVYSMFWEAQTEHEMRKDDHEKLVASIVKLVRPLGSCVDRKSDHETEISLYDFTNCSGDIRITGESVEFHVRAKNPDSIECLALAVACLR